jgi:hypothetical protein
MSKENYRGFRFHYVNDPESSGKIKVYVEQQPSYQGRDMDMNVIHRWSGKNGSPPYICFKENFKPSSLYDAKKQAHDWADRTLVYISTGSTISQQYARA